MLFDNDRGIAGDVLTEMSRDRARIGVVTAARREGDDQTNRLTLIESIVRKSCARKTADETVTRINPDNPAG